MTDFQSSNARLGAAFFSPGERSGYAGSTPSPPQPTAAGPSINSPPPPYKLPRPEEFDEFELPTLNLDGATKPTTPAGDRVERNLEFYKPRPDKKRPYYLGTIGVLFTALVAVSSLLGTTSQANAQCQKDPKTVTVMDTSTTVSTLSVTTTQVSTSTVSTTLSTTLKATQTTTDLSTTTVKPTINSVTTTVVTSFSLDVSVLPSTKP